MESLDVASKVPKVILLPDEKDNAGQDRLSKVVDESILIESLYVKEQSA